MNEVLLELGYCYVYSRYIKSYEECIVLVDTEKGYIQVHSKAGNQHINKKYSTRHDGEIFKDILYAKIKDYLVEGEEI